MLVRSPGLRAPCFVVSMIVLALGCTAEVAPEPTPLAPLRVQDWFAMKPGPRGRETACAVGTGTEMIVWGGRRTELDGTVYLGNGARFDVERGTWDKMDPSNAPSPRACQHAVWAGDRMYVWGGEGAEGLLNDGGVYRPEIDQWAPMAPSSLEPRSDHVVAFVSEQLVVWGGRGAVGMLAGGGRYDSTVGRWRGMSVIDEPLAREGAHFGVVGDELIIWGGRDEAGLRSDGARYDAKRNVWRPISTDGAPRFLVGQSANVVDGKFIVLGGEEHGDAVRTGASYDPATDTWRPIALAPVPQSEHTAIAFGRALFVVGEAELLTYRPSSDVWTELETTRAPLSRVDFVATATEDSVVVWGGRMGDTWPRTGSLLTP